MDLTILAGTTLRFEKGMVLVVNGSLDLAGEIDQPVLLTAIGSSWGGIAALGNEVTKIPLDRGGD